jgi:hypothetical protein
LQANIESIKKTSYLAELELLFNYALHSPKMPVGDMSIYMGVINEYIDKFYDKADVVEEIRPYL